MQNHKNVSQLSLASVVMTLGLVYGDIGTSPLYVLKAIVGDEAITEELIFGGLSCIFWTLSTITSFKYVYLTLQADNRGEGGILSLYALVRRKWKWLIFPAILGAASLLADGIITPAISVSAAIEGLRVLSPDVPTIPLVLIILVLLFSFQKVGTKILGSSFGIGMLVWFSMLSILGCVTLLEYPRILLSINPLYGYNLLVNHPQGFWLLGAVFLCTTGAEAVYSDLGHCGKSNIRISWMFVKIALVLNYLGQGAWLMLHAGEKLDGRNPFFEIMPAWFLVPGIIISTVATIIASQALISGSFTIASEAVALNLLPKLKIKYPTDIKGQCYVPLINYFLLIGCISVVLYFKESSNMEAAYGLAIVQTMLMTTILLTYYLLMRRTPAFLIWIFTAFFLFVEGALLVANASKFTHGGWFAISIGLLLFTIMWIWNRGFLLRKDFVEYVSIKNYLDVLVDLSKDETVPKYSTNLVYLTGADSPHFIESRIIYSILRKKPKRADIYWFLHVGFVDDPYTMEYKVKTFVPGKVFRIDFQLGFRVEPKLNFLFRKAVEDLVANNEVDILSRYPSLRSNNIPGDFGFVIMRNFLSYDNDLPWRTRNLMQAYFLIRNMGVTAEKSFGIDNNLIHIEDIPLLISGVKNYDLVRVG